MSSTPPAKDSASVHSRDSAHSHHSFSSLLPRVHSHSSIASALLGPALSSSAGISLSGASPATHDSHNPFALGALGEDGKRKKSSRKSRLASAGRRSLSPFRHHSSSKRSSSVAPLPKDERRGSTDARSDTDAETGESGDDGAASSSSRRRLGLTPRNNAFSAGADSDGDGDGDEEWERVVPAAAAEERVESAPRKSAERGAESASGSEHETGDEETEDDEEEYLEFDDETIDNTLRNAGCIGLHDAWQHDAEPAGYGPSDYDASHLGEMHPSGHEEDAHLAEAPNVVLGEQQAPAQPQTPVFERNRCTITLVHGEYEKAARENKRPKRYVVASDGSDEASYAIEWCIGTVLRDGDETLVCSVMETDAKLDASNPSHEDKANRLENQKLRQSMAVILARQVTATLQRTRLGVKVSCQALHARNSRHMICDLLDYYSPTMCIVGSRGLGSLKGILLGSTSHYLVQKSPVPVMVARRRLRLPALPRGKSDVVASVRRRHMSLDQAAIEKDSNVADEDPDEEREGEGKGKSSDTAVGAGNAQAKAGAKSTEEKDAQPTASSDSAAAAQSADEPTTPTASDAKRNDKAARDVAAQKPKVSSPGPEDLAEAEAERQRSKNEAKAAAAAAAKQQADAKGTEEVTRGIEQTSMEDKEQEQRGRSPEPRPTAGEAPAAAG